MELSDKQSSNGRVDINGPKTSDLFQMYDKIPVNQCTTFRNPTEGLWDNTALSNAFFSAENMVIIQNGIRVGVYKKSNGQYVISDQDGDTLKIIMRSIFLQNSRQTMLAWGFIWPRYLSKKTWAEGLLRKR